MEGRPARKNNMKVGAGGKEVVEVGIAAAWTSERRCTRWDLHGTWHEAVQTDRPRRALPPPTKHRNCCVLARQGGGNGGAQRRGASFHGGKRHVGPRLAVEPNKNKTCIMESPTKFASDGVESGSGVEGRRRSKMVLRRPRVSPPPHGARSSPASWPTLRPTPLTPPVENRAATLGGGEQGTVRHGSAEAGRAGRSRAWTAAPGGGRRVSPHRRNH